MKIYIATPITNRPEATMEERLKAAKERVEKIAQYMREERRPVTDGDPLRTAEYCSTFDVNPIGCNHTEAEAMGNCIRLLLECDAIMLDKGMAIYSKGMDAEHFTANAFSKNVFYFWPETIPTHFCKQKTDK